MTPANPVRKFQTTDAHKFSYVMAHSSLEETIALGTKSVILGEAGGM